MLTVGNMMSLVTKGKVKVTDPVGKALYKQFKQVDEEIVIYIFQASVFLLNILLCVSKRFSVK